MEDRGSTRVLDLKVDWPAGELLQPRGVLMSLDFGEFEDPQDVEIDLAHAYRHYDRCEEARGAGAPPPSPTGILMPAQLRTLELLEQEWDEVVATLGALYPAALRERLRWTTLLLSHREKDGRVYVTLSGYVDSPRHGAYTESGIGAVLLGATPLAAGERGVGCPMPSVPAVPCVPRPHPSANLGVDEVRRRVAANDWAGLRRRAEETPGRGVSAIDHVLLQEILGSPPEDAVALLSTLRPLMARAEVLPSRLLGHDPGVLRALVRAGRFTIPGDILLNETDPERIRAWVAIGAKSRAQQRPRREDKAADPPEPGRALAAWLERGWLELAPDASQTLVSAALERLMATSDEPEPLIAMLAKVPGVEEIYVDDDELRSLLAEW